MKYHATLTRYRNNPHIRNLLAQTVLHSQKFVQVIFVDENLEQASPVKHLAHFWIDTKTSVIETIKNDIAQGINAFILFCVPKAKENAVDFTKSVIFDIKSYFKSDIYLICDLCFCNIAQDNHCGIMNKQNLLLNNNLTVQQLATMALEFADSGADCIAPSDMRDGRIMAIRTILNDNGFDNIPIMSYSTKFASNYYSAFREIYKSGIDKLSPLQDRKTYQIDYRNTNDAILSSMRDETEGADILMVKPIMRYLDIAWEIKSRSNLPIAAFHVSSECVALNLLAENQYGNLADLFLEDWHAIKRGGVDIIISYCARMVKKWS